jgi:hypothetical protein
VTDPQEDVGAYLILMMQRSDDERRHAELRVREVLADSYSFEREHLQHVGPHVGLSAGYESIVIGQTTD